MATPAEIMLASAALLNDTEGNTFTPENQLPYLNMAMDELQELFELNNIPVTNKTTITLPVAANVSRIGFTGTIPQLPADLVEIEQLWESQSGQNVWIPMTKHDFLPLYLEDNTQINQFIFWAWTGQEIRLIAANANNDLKIQYIAKIFRTPIPIEEINNPLAVININSFLQYRTAGLVARFVGENPTRADMLDGDAALALDRTLGISTKGRQAIFTRRRPFRAGYKNRGWW